MESEAGKKELIYRKVDPNNAEQIEDASFCEREGFGTGLDPQELPPILRFIARYGNIWLQYAVEDGKYNIIGMMELIPLVQALKYRPKNIGSGAYDLSLSPFTIIMANQERVFRDVRRFAGDENITYYHGIAMSRKGGGYGTLLLRHVLENDPRIKKSVVVCFPDAAHTDKESGNLRLAPNENSFTLHLKAGFVLAGVVKPPVYDETVIYYSFVRLPSFSEEGRKELFLNLAKGPADELLGEVQKHASRGYLGVSYSKETHEMRFVLCQKHKSPRV